MSWDTARIFFGSKGYKRLSDGHIIYTHFRNKNLIFVDVSRDSIFTDRGRPVLKVGGNQGLLLPHTEIKLTKSGGKKQYIVRLDRNFYYPKTYNDIKEEGVPLTFDEWVSRAQSQDKALSPITFGY